MTAVFLRHEIYESEDQKNWSPEQKAIADKMLDHAFKQTADPTPAELAAMRQPTETRPEWRRRRKEENKGK
jgi:hypothetical protein